LKVDRVISEKRKGRSCSGLPWRSDVSRNTVVYGHLTSVEAKRPKDARVFERHAAWPPPTFLFSISTLNSRLSRLKVYSVFVEAGWSDALTDIITRAGINSSIIDS
jgi:hypothetical protein